MILKILIVDDEPLVRNYLRSLIDWESNGYLICGEAADGAEAIRKLEEYAPDIIIMDIYMSGMDGVALSKIVNERFPDIGMIILSSYDNYDYVRDTMRNGAIDYLLKHRLDSEMLLEVLKKVRDKIQAGASKHQRDITAAKEIELANPTLVQSYVKDMVLGNRERLQTILGYLSAAKLYVNTPRLAVLVMQLEYFDINTYKYGDKDKNTLIRNITEICTQIIGNLKDGCAAYIDQGRFVILLSFEEIKSENAIFNQIQKSKTRLTSSLKLFFNFSVIFGCGYICNSFAELSKCYEAAYKDLEGQGFVEKDGRLANDPMEFISLSLSQEKQLLSAIESGNRVLTGLIIEEIFDCLKTAPPRSKGIQMVIRELMDIAHKAGLKSGIDLSWVTESSETERWSQYKKLEDIEVRIIGFYKKIIEEIQSRGNRSGQSRYVKEAISFIESLYMKEISLENAAKKIGVTPTYLSRLFKEETGVTFTEYLNKVRIEVSKKLIDNGDRVKSIYSEVGFKNYSYFFKVFKEISNQTPLEYANRVKIF